MQRLQAGGSPLCTQPNDGLQACHCLAVCARQLSGFYSTLQTGFLDCFEAVAAWSAAALAHFAPIVRCDVVHRDHPLCSSCGTAGGRLQRQGGRLPARSLPLCGPACQHRDPCGGWSGGRGRPGAQQLRAGPGGVVVPRGGREPHARRQPLVCGAAQVRRQIARGG